MQQSVFFVGTKDEVAHHAAPLTDIDYDILAPEEVIAQAEPGDLAIFFSEHFDRFRNACNSLKSKNVATLYMIDGILEWRNAWDNRDDEPACPWTMRPVLSHKVACIGPSQARVLAAWGNAAKVEITGVPRFERLKLLASKPRQKQASEFHLLVMTAKCPGFTDEQVSNTIQALSDLKGWFASNPSLNGRDVKVTWRLTKDLNEEIGVENQLQDLTGEDFSTVLQSVDAVITTPSTAIIEAMVMNVPVATLDYNNTPQYITTAWQISAASQIARIVPELLNPDESRLFFQQTALRDSLHQANAIEQFSQLVMQMLETASQQVQTGKALEFSENMLNYKGFSEFPFLQHEKIFSNTGEFSIDDKRQLQSELGHARREIDHLHRQIKQLKSELQEAHEIFDQIQQHPIAGPVVRARQKLIDWFTAFKSKKNKVNDTSTRSKNSSTTT